MATLRQRFKVSWDGGDEVIVVTTVADLISAVDYLPENQRRNSLAISTAQIYSALLRDGFGVDDYQKWLLVLDNFEELPLKVEVEGPTKAAVSPIARSLSPSSPEPIGAAGLTKTTGHS